MEASGCTVNWHDVETCNTVVILKEIVLLYSPHHSYFRCNAYFHSYCKWFNTNTYCAASALHYCYFVMYCHAYTLVVNIHFSA